MFRHFLPALLIINVVLMFSCTKENLDSVTPPDIPEHANRHQSRQLVPSKIVYKDQLTDQTIVETYLTYENGKLTMDSTVTPGSQTIKRTYVYGPGTISSTADFSLLSNYFTLVNDRVVQSSSVFPSYTNSSSFQYSGDHMDSIHSFLGLISGQRTNLDIGLGFEGKQLLKLGIKSTFKNMFSQQSTTTFYENSFRFLSPYRVRIHSNYIQTSDSEIALYPDVLTPFAHLPHPEVLNSNYFGRIVYFHEEGLNVMDIGQTYLKDDHLTKEITYNIGTVNTFKSRYTVSKVNEGHLPTHLSLVWGPGSKYDITIEYTDLNRKKDGDWKDDDQDEGHDGH